MLSHVTRPRCANWNGRSESVPPCGCSPAPSRTVECVDIFWSADPGPWRRARIHLRLFSWSRQNYRAWLQWLVSAQLAHVALDRLIATVERIFGDQVLPDCGSISTAAQT